MQRNRQIVVQRLISWDECVVPWEKEKAAKAKMTGTKAAQFDWMAGRVW